MTAADDDRRAEIEAVARDGLQRILDMGCPLGREGDLLGQAQKVASETITKLNTFDRVRDARGDDEAVCPACENTGIDRREGIPCGCGARSPQDEDHETIRPEQPPPDKLGGQPPAEPKTP